MGREVGGWVDVREGGHLWDVTFVKENSVTQQEL